MIACVQCGKETRVAHYNWDPAGPVCEDCWYEEATEMLRQADEEMAELERHYRECLG